MSWLTLVQEVNEGPARYKTLVTLAHELLAEGLVQPWPATLVALATATDDQPHYLPSHLLEQLIRHFLAIPTRDPFRPGAAVLVRLKPKDPIDRWASAVIHTRHETDDGQLLCDVQIGSETHPKLVEGQAATGS